MAKNKNKKNGQKKNPVVKLDVNNNVENIEETNNVEVLENKQEEAVLVEEKKEVKEEPKKAKTVKAKKEKRQSKIGRKFKESFSELKKVTWPTFPKVVKQTGVVLGVVVFFTLVLFGFDYILKFLFKLLNGVEYTQGELWGSVGIAGAIVLVVIMCLIVWAVKRKKRESK